MGEMPRIITVRVGGKDIELFVYYCNACDTVFAVDGDPIEEPSCPNCQTNNGVTLLEELT